MVVVLVFAQGIIIPFILAILFWFLIRVIKKGLFKIPLLRRLPGWLITIFSSLILLSFLFLTIVMITVNIRYLSATLPIYEANINKISDLLERRYDMDMGLVFDDLLKDVNFGGIL